MDGGKLYFTIGGEIQKPEDFRRQIATRFGDESNFQKAWNGAKDIIRKYDKETLESGRRFFDEVFKPRKIRSPVSGAIFKPCPKGRDRK